MITQISSFIMSIYSEALGNSCKAYEGENDNTENRDKSHMYRDQQIHPCHLSSSIYYGGQDLYVCPPGSQGSELGTVVSV